MLRKLGLLFFCLVFCLCLSTFAETGAEGWLRYAPLTADQANTYSPLPRTVAVIGNSQIVRRAGGELARGVGAMLGKNVSRQSSLPASDAILIGTASDLRALLSAWQPGGAAPPESFVLGTTRAKGHTYWIVSGTDERGVLYGTFRFLEMIARGEDLSRLGVSEAPAARVRWVNHWDNLDGSIERGYAGPSIFFENGTVRADLSRAQAYARLLASVGINGCTVNNVNVDLRILTPEMIRQVARIADVFRPWGVRLSLSIDLSSPKAIGGLDTFDPLDPRVIEWWQKKVDEIYSVIPDFGGVVIKADSEGRPGPRQYGRSPAEAANLLARPLKPHGGIVLYRGFVYNHRLDWNDIKADRARAGYDNFRHLDGQFEDNVVIQIKHGPIDFQVREPVSPLFGALRQTNQAIELQITQEYMGQQRHMVFQVPMWKDVLDFDLRVEGRSTPVKEVVEGKAFRRPTGGFVGVSNVGMDTNWLHHPLAMANLYGFGRLAWNPQTKSETIADDWTRLTFGNNPKVVKTIDDMLLRSWGVYEQYTGPLGVGGLTDIIHVHFGPGIESAERNGWGQWIRADNKGIGMDRTVATGTGYTGQYPPEVARVYESLESCPDELVLFFHHLPYDHRLHSGKTLIQHVYDSHYEGADAAAGFVEQWRSLIGLIDEERFKQVLAFQEYQAGHAIVWRDAVCNWFLRISGIPDAKGRVGNYPGRIEAEKMMLDGYAPVDVTPWETASGAKGVVCTRDSACSASTTVAREAGNYRVVVQYFDLPKGISKFRLLVNNRPVGEWIADNVIPTPSQKLDGHTSTRRVFPQVLLKKGDVVKVEGRTDTDEPAPLDYIEIVPASPGAPSGMRISPGA